MQSTMSIIANNTNALAAVRKITESSLEYERLYYQSMLPAFLEKGESFSSGIPRVHVTKIELTTSEIPDQKIICVSQWVGDGENAVKIHPYEYFSMENIEMAIDLFWYYANCFSFNNNFTLFGNAFKSEIGTEDKSVSTTQPIFCRFTCGNGTEQVVFSEDCIEFEKPEMVYSSDDLRFFVVKYPTILNFFRASIRLGLISLNYSFTDVFTPVTKPEEII